MSARESISTPIGEIWIESGASGIRKVSFQQLSAPFKRNSRDISARCRSHMFQCKQALLAYIDKKNHSAALPIFDWSVVSESHRVVLQALLDIPFGSTCSYSELAKHAGYTGASRFVGTVMKHNPFVLLIPCHRVIKSNGMMGEYNGGAAIKRKLLLHEGFEVTAGKVKRPFSSP